jgi:hypothetical protein
VRLSPYHQPPSLLHSPPSVVPLSKKKKKKEKKKYPQKEGKDDRSMIIYRAQFVVPTSLLLQVQLLYIVRGDCIVLGKQEEKKRKLRKEKKRFDVVCLEGKKSEKIPKK